VLALIASCYGPALGLPDGGPGPGDAATADAPGLLTLGENIGDTSVAVSDCFLRYVEPDTVFGYAPSVDMNSLGARQVGLLRFELAPLDLSGGVQSAELVVVVTDGSADGEVALYEVLEDWDEVQATWNSRLAKTPWASAGATAGSRGAMIGGFTSPSAGEVTVRLPVELVLVWHGDDSQNHGVALELDSATSDAMSFVSSEGSDGARPRLRLALASP
jgi:hypothetical protein